MAIGHYESVIEDDGVSSATAKSIDLLCDIVLEFQEQRNEALNRNTLIGHLKQQSMATLEEPVSRPGSEDVTDHQPSSPIKSTPHPYQDSPTKT